MSDVIMQKANMEEIQLASMGGKAEKLYRVTYTRISMPKGTDGRYYTRKVNPDGSVTFTPAVLVAAKQENKQEVADNDGKDPVLHD